MKTFARFDIHVLRQDNRFILLPIIYRSYHIELFGVSVSQSYLTPCVNINIHPMKLSDHGFV